MYSIHMWLYYVMPFCLPDSQVGHMYLRNMQALSLVPLLVTRSCLPMLYSRPHTTVVCKHLIMTATGNQKRACVQVLTENTRSPWSPPSIQGRHFCNRITAFSWRSCLPAPRYCVQSLLPIQITHSQARSVAPQHSKHARICFPWPHSASAVKLLVL